jgi:uncharacterized iron-regulated protein
MAFVAMTACSTIKPPVPPLASIEGVQGDFGIGRIVHLKTGKAISFDQLIDQVGARRLIFIGEVHNNPEHHLIQVQILQALMSQYKSLNLAMEFFNETQQSVLNHYLAGSTTETEFLRDVGWDKNWAYAYHFYRPLLLMTKEKDRKILAINAPRTIVRKVARSGLSSLAPNERNQLASHINLKNESHREYLYQIYKKHSHQDLKRFDFFYQAQCVWEDTMAENISKYLSKTKEKLVVLTGNGHIVNKYGIPNRTLNRIKIPMVTILLQPLTGPLTLKRKMADYIWLTGACS